MLVVGLGPVGAACALLCAAQGLSVRVIERDTEIYRQPRAVQLDFEVMRQLNLVGVAQQVLAASCPSTGYEFVNSQGELLMSRYPPPGEAPTGYPYANMFHQPSLEAALRTRLAGFANATVHLGTEAVRLAQDEYGVHLRTRSTQGEDDFSASYLIGCDGGRSFVRQSLGIDMDDSGFEEPWVVVDVKLPEGMRQLRSVGVQHCDPEGPTTSVPSGPGRHRWEFMLLTEADRTLATSSQALRTRLANWVDPDDMEIERSAVYEFHGLIAQSWRLGRCLIIGDAAHQMPPFFGQGLCSGIRDALNLAWKLRAVLRNEAPPALLDTLYGERAPHVASITEGAIELGRLVCMSDKEAARQRDERMIADRRANRPQQFPAMPKVRHGVLEDGAGGRVFPEPMAHDRGLKLARLDDLAGYAPLLILGPGALRTSADVTAVERLRAGSADLAVCSLDAPDAAGGRTFRLKDQRGLVRKALAGAPAMLVKPDRIQFGIGNPPMLAERWGAYLQGALKP